MLQILQVSTPQGTKANKFSVKADTVSQSNCIFSDPKQWVNIWVTAVYAESPSSSVFNSKIRFVISLCVKFSSQQVMVVKTVTEKRKHKQTYICTLVCKVTDSFFWANCQFHWNNPAWLQNWRRKTGQNVNSKTQPCYGTLSCHVIITAFSD